MVIFWFAVLKREAFLFHINSLYGKKDSNYGFYKKFFPFGL